MNFGLFFCSILPAQCRKMVTITRYECDITITPIVQTGDLRVPMEISMGRSRMHFLEQLGDQTSVTIRLHVEKKRVVGTLRRGSNLVPKCNGIRVEAAVRQSFDDYELFISSKMKPTYVSTMHPEDCKYNEIGYPDSGTCHKNGIQCLNLKTKVKKCRCQAGYWGTNCEKLINF